MNNNITSTYATLQDGVNDVQSRIFTTSTELASGKQPLSKQDASVVARLSNLALSQSAVQDDIKNANNLIGITQTGLTSIASILNQMNSLASQVSNAVTNSNDQTTLYNSFTQLSEEVSSIARSTTLNGNNLLTSNNTISVISSNDGVNKQSTQLQGIDVTSFEQALSNISFAGDDPNSATNAQLVIGLINQFVSKVSSAQSSYTAAKEALNNNLTASTTVQQNAQNTVDKIQKVDTTALQLNLQALNNQQTLDFQVASQLHSMAASILSIFS